MELCAFATFPENDWLQNGVFTGSSLQTTVVTRNLRWRLGNWKSSCRLALFYGQNFHISIFRVLRHLKHDFIKFTHVFEVVGSSMALMSSGESKPERTERRSGTIS